MIYFWNDHKATEKLNFKHLSKPVCCWYILALKNLSIMYYLPMFSQNIIFSSYFDKPPRNLKKMATSLFFHCSSSRFISGKMPSCIEMQIWWCTMYCPPITFVQLKKTLNLHLFAHKKWGLEIPRFGLTFAQRDSL